MIEAGGGGEGGESSLGFCRRGGLHVSSRFGNSFMYNHLSSAVSKLSRFV